MKWHFPRLPSDQVETEITQRDQFNNDEVELSETIVREAIQNSLDAAKNDSLVKVKFSFLDVGNGLSPGCFVNLLKLQEDHAIASGLDLSMIDHDSPSALIIEDFGTIGLTGSTISKDKDNFTDFWRRHGKSHKHGKNRGRWGLGKLVYSCTSNAGVFFGITNREGDEQSHLMGQTVLNLHTYQDKSHPPHAFFCDLLNEDDPIEVFPIPIQDDVFVEDFKEKFQLDRKSESGLSIVIPFPDNLDSQRMIGITIANYFYPIITKKLEVQINQIVVDSENIRELAHRFASKSFAQLDILFDFIEQASSTPPSKLLKMNPSWCDDEKLGSIDFEPEVLEQIRERFGNGELVALELPITLTKKDDSTVETSFSVFIKRPSDLEKGVDLYVRGGLTLPSESKFKERRALAVLVAEEEQICAFLGDAENAAHTQWTSNTEKLRKNYKNNQAQITLIKKALIHLYDLLADIVEEKDEDALAGFFWFDEPNSPKPKPKPKPKPTPKPEPPQPPVLPSKKRKINLTKQKEGFSIQADEGLVDEDLPKEINVTLGYEVSKGDAFKSWDIYDFELGKDIRISTSGGVEDKGSSGQKMTLNITSRHFFVEVTGFDKNRDLKIKLV